MVNAELKPGSNIVHGKQTLFHFSSMFSKRKWEIYTFLFLFFCFLPGLSKAESPLKGTVTFKKQNENYFKAFSNIYVNICPCKKKFQYIFVLVFFSVGEDFTKHLRKCLQEITIVPFGVNFSRFRGNYFMYFFFFSCTLGNLETCAIGRQDRTGVTGLLFLPCFCSGTHI